jgi:hypothetical protein
MRCPGAGAGAQSTFALARPGDEAAMIYKFKSKASGDIIMMAPTADALMRAIGRDPAPKGIIEPADMPAAMAAIEQAVQADEAARADAEREAAARGERLAPREGVALRQRLWPMLDMLKRADAAGEPVVWGV